MSDDGADGEARDVAAVVATVRDRVDPDADERQRLDAVVDALVARAEAAIDERGFDADVVQVGSTARETWVSGDRDVDVFVRFPADLDREELEERGLAVGRAVLPDGHEEYAEHPYVAGVYEGFDVDLVPCYRVEVATDIRSAVDRTPFHDAYLRERLDADAAADVRVFKQFCKGVGVYGSNLATRGLSGFLSELLVLEYGGFRETLAAVADWHPPVRLDPEGHGDAEFDDPLVVVDPTDPERNVAAVVAAESVARLQHHARAFLESPTVDRFFPEPPAPLTAEDVRAHLDRRGTEPVAVRFDAPDVVDDQLYPQLRRSREGLVRGLRSAGFDVVRSATLAHGGGRPAALFVELASATLPAVERHEGPPVHVANHARSFYDAYADDDGAYGPFVDGERYVVERPRSVRRAETFVAERLFDVALGAQVETALESGYETLVGEETASLASEFGVALARYFDPSP